MGSRTKSEGPTKQTSTESWVYSSGAGPGSSNFTSKVVGRYLKGYNLKDFHKRKRKGGLLPHTPFKQTQYQGVWTGGSYSAVNPSSPKDSGDGNTYNASNWKGAEFTGSPYMIDHFGDGPYPTGGLPDLSNVQALIHAAASSVYTKGWDALTSGAEAHKLYGLFRSLAMSVARWRSLIRDPKKVADAWLSLRYGVRPLLYDIRDLHEALTEFDVKRRIYSERSGTSYSEASNTLVRTRDNVNSLHFELWKEVQVNHSIRGNVTGLFVPKRILMDPVNTAWELVPFSFVIDWLIDIGSYLNSLAFMSQSQGYVASYGYESNYVVTYTCEGSNGNNRNGSANTSYVYSGSIQERSPTSISNLPQLKGKALNVFQIGDLLALLLQTRQYR